MTKKHKKKTRGSKKQTKPLTWKRLNKQLNNLFSKLDQSVSFTYSNYTDVAFKKFSLYSTQPQSIDSGIGFYQRQFSTRYIPQLEEIIKKLLQIAKLLSKGEQKNIDNVEFYSDMQYFVDQANKVLIFVARISALLEHADEHINLSPLRAAVSDAIRLRTNESPNPWEHYVSIVRDMQTNHDGNASLVSQSKAANSYIKGFYHCMMENYFTMLCTPAELQTTEVCEHYHTDLLWYMSSHQYLVENITKDKRLTNDDRENAIDYIYHKYFQFSNETKQSEITSNLRYYIGSFAGCTDFEKLLPKNKSQKFPDGIYATLLFIYAAPAADGFNPIEFFYSCLPEQYKTNPRLIAFFNHIQRIATQQNRYASQLSTHESAYTGAMDAFQQQQLIKQTKAERITSHLAKLSHPVVLLDDEESDGEEVKQQDKPIVTAAIKQSALFPLIDFTFERYCCQLHLDLMSFATNIREQVVNGLKQRPLNFSGVTYSMEDMLSVIGVIDDIDSNHRAQKLMFTVGMYLQVVNGHLPYLSRLESQLPVITSHTSKAIDMILTFEKTDITDLHPDYKGMLSILIDEVKQCHQRLVRAEEKNYQRTQRILERAAARRQRIFEETHERPERKPRSEWHSATRTNSCARTSGLIDDDRASLAFIEMEQPAAGNGDPHLFPLVRREIKVKYGVFKKVEEAKKKLRLKSPKTKTTLSNSPDDWFLDQAASTCTVDDGIVFDNSTFKLIMQSLHAINPELSRRIRLQGGQLRDYLLSGSSTGDWDFRFFGDITFLQHHLGGSTITIIPTNEGPLLQTKVALPLLNGSTVTIDVTTQVCNDEDLHFRLHQPSNADFEANGLYTYQNKEGNYIIMNHEGSCDPASVIASAQAPLDVISTLPISRDPLLILRTLKMQGQFSYDITATLADQLNELQDTFDLSIYPQNIQDRFRAYLCKYYDLISSAGILTSLPTLQKSLDDINDSVTLRTQM
ncbi:MAG: hypothetical protein P1U40_10365 [Coxiellaceae bacterium]|nr:hypothetical protein [Coxiellaceae bacterium]